MNIKDNVVGSHYTLDYPKLHPLSIYGAIYYGQFGRTWSDCCTQVVRTETGIVRLGISKQQTVKGNNKQIGW